MIGNTLAHYEFTEKLGQSGMGEVFCARGAKLDCEVAIKVLPFESSTHRSRFPGPFTPYVLSVCSGRIESRLAC